MSDFKKWQDFRNWQEFRKWVLFLNSRLPHIYNKWVKENEWFYIQYQKLNFHKERILKVLVSECYFLYPLLSFVKVLVLNSVYKTTYPDMSKKILVSNIKSTNFFILINYVQPNNKLFLRHMNDLKNITLSKISIIINKFVILFYFVIYNPLGRGL